MRDAAELASLRASTKAFIDSDVDEFSFERSEWENDGAGGKRPLPPAPRAPQRGKFQALSSQRMNERVSPSSGTIVVPRFEIVMEWDADVRIGDTFSFEGHDHEVVFVADEQDFVKKAEVTRDGA